MKSKLTQSRALLAFSVVMLQVGITLLVFGVACMGGSSDKSHDVVISSVSAPSATAITGPVNSSPPARIVIQSIKVDAAIMTLGRDRNLALEVPDYQNSRNPGAVVGWYNVFPTPGAGSNAIFAGHVTFDGRAVFYHLDQVSPGDTVTIMTEDGKTLVYRVFENLTVDPSRVDVLNPTGEDIVTLITCGGGDFIEVPGEQFGGHYPNRVVVRARLAQVA
jgi:LPXTG-site transpeptidase (sortase) family protein